MDLLSGFGAPAAPAQAPAAGGMDMLSGFGAPAPTPAGGMDMLSGFGAAPAMGVTGAGPGTEWVSATPAEFQQLASIGQAFPAQKEQLSFDTNVHVSYQKFRAAEGLVVALSIYNRTGAPINGTVVVDPPGCVTLAAGNQVPFQAGPNSAGAAVMQMSGSSHTFGFTCVAKVNYGSGFVNVSVPMSMADYLRPVQGMQTPQFGAAWQQAGMVERKAHLQGSSLRSAEAFMAKCQEFGISPIQAIGTEAVAVGKMMGTNAMILMHGKTSAMELELLMRSPDKDLVEAVNTAARNDPTFK